MAKHKVEIEFDVGQEKAIKKAADIKEKEVLVLISEMANETVKAQVNQWIRDAITAKMDELEPGVALARLEYGDV